MRSLISALLFITSVTSAPAPALFPRSDGIGSVLSPSQPCAPEGSQYCCGTESLYCAGGVYELAFACYQAQETCKFDSGGIPICG